MILTSGVRFMCASRSGVRGCASGSASAAAWRSASLIASKRLQSCLVGLVVVFMVLPSLIGLRAPGRNDTDRLASHRVADKEQATLGHADPGIAVFAVILGFVEPIKRKRIVEHSARRLERDAVTGEVRRSLDVVPLEFPVIH